MHLLRSFVICYCHISIARRILAQDTHVQVQVMPLCTFVTAQAKVVTGRIPIPPLQVLRFAFPFLAGRQFVI